jgi:hypothetical protein
MGKVSALAVPHAYYITVRLLFLRGFRLLFVLLGFLDVLSALAAHERPPLTYCSFVN